MNRRDILRYTAWLTGSRVAAPLAAAVLAGCSDATDTPTAANASSSRGRVLHFFSPEAFERATRVADTLLPQTDSPSASDVGVPETLDSMLGLALKQSYVDEFRRQWQALDAQLLDSDFTGMDADAREAWLSNLETTSDPARADAREGLVMLKQQVVVYYLTSETIGEEYLNYLPVPGRYQPCISVDDVDNKKWAI